ncbi:DUF4873 domain-containing protein [Streptomyces sp. NPDC005899]|uniref:DUF4873 domain-containing protein n=1 Tax=Streptomyces sp. NPDC005899 TaxID=3155716 RepID=UPI0033CC884C
MTHIYEGPATLVIGGEETKVTAVLRAADHDGSGSWSGTVSADGLQAAFWAAVQSSGVTIRMPGGRQGVAQIDMDAESGSAQVTGGGPAPF